MKQVLIGIFIAVIAGLILDFLTSEDNVSSHQNIHIVSNQQSTSSSTNGGSSNVIQNNNININYNGK